MRSAKGERTLPIGDFYRLPGNTPQRDTNLNPDELIVAVTLPPSAFAEHAHYLKVRDRASYAFALVSVAAALELRDGIVRNAALALGGVAHKPWRVPEAERALVGHKLERARIESAAQALLRGAHPYEHNRYKVALAKNAVIRAVSKAGGLA